MLGKLFFGIMYPSLEHYQKAADELVKQYGQIELESEEYGFSFTDYYQDEFGTGLKKRFVVFQDPIARDSLPDIKLFSCELERKFGKNTKRVVNIDPGYITSNNVVVASAKEFPSRIYLGKGIYGDLQLILKRSEAVVMPFTFADYKLNKDFFLRMRRLAPK